MGVLLQIRIAQSKLRKQSSCWTHITSTRFEATPPNGRSPTFVGSPTAAGERLTTGGRGPIVGEMITRGDGYGEGGSTEDSDSKEGKIGSEFHNALD